LADSYERLVSASRAPCAVLCGWRVWYVYLYHSVDH
jgi:hypothetical protein